MEPIIRIEHLTHTYSAGTPFQRSAVEDVSLDIMPGEFLGIIGHTGSGKSTLIQHLNGLLRPTQGRVLLNGKDIWAEPKKIRQVRFQVGLTEDQLEKSPFELSGGQKRRVAIAGVIAMEPKVLILDEPTAGLDPAGAASILANIETYRQANHATVILVSHSMEDVARLADRLVVVSQGTLPYVGTPREVFSRVRAMGVDIDPAVYTVEQAKAAILDALRKKGGR